MRAKQTQAMLTEANKMLKGSTCSSQVRHGMICMIDVILTRSNSYKGDRYLTVDEVPPTELPGTLGNGDSRTFPDDTRRHYA